eukprot:124211-Amphidinium_carterae.1
MDIGKMNHPFWGFTGDSIRLPQVDLYIYHRSLNTSTLVHSIHLPRPVCASTHLHSSAYTSIRVTLNIHRRLITSTGSRAHYSKAQAAEARLSEM